MTILDTKKREVTRGAKGVLERKDHLDHLTKGLAW